MTTPTAILFGFALLAAAIAFHALLNFQITERAVSAVQRTAPRYALAQNTGGSVWRMDTKTGSVSQCEILLLGDPNHPVCTQWTKK